MLRSLARSLTRFGRSFVLSPLEKIAVAAFFYGSGRIVVGAFSDLCSLDFGMDGLSLKDSIEYGTLVMLSDLSLHYE